MRRSKSGDSKRRSHRGGPRFGAHMSIAGGVANALLRGQQSVSRGMLFLLPSPARGGACKRLHLFLRWMVRRDHIDFGLWPEVTPAKLIIPLDTHVAQVSKHLCLTRRKSPGLAMALDITRNLKCFDAADPVKYDFALCRLGMLGNR